MRRATGAFLALFLAGCTLAVPGDKADAPSSPTAIDAIEVTKLDAARGASGAVTPKAVVPAAKAGTEPGPAAGGGASPTSATPEPATPEPATDPAAEVAPEPDAPAEAAPVAALSPAALACQKRGGRYVKTGSGDLRACVKVTGQEGKSCKRETDCIGACLARSGTCAPVTPLFGCNEILQADGRRVTLCLD